MRSAISGKVFKNGPSKICGRRPLKNLKGYGYGLLKHFSGILIYLIYLKQSPRVVLEKLFPKFRGKTPVPKSPFYKVAGLQPAILLKKVLLQAFSCEFCENC